MIADLPAADLPRFDLHMHSTASDGALSPQELVELASENGVKLLALTDHDTLSGLDEAAATARQCGIRFVPGVELTCRWNTRVIHLLGLGIDPAHEGWKGYIENLEGLRQARAEKIAKRLVAKKLPEDLLARAQALAGSGQIGRPHFARALIEAGIVSTESEAFDRYLGQGKPGDVKAEWPDMHEAIEQVKASGGFALLAHPTKYNLTFSRLRILVKELGNAGADGFEVAYPGVSQEQIRLLMRMADQHDMYVSAGSDFHTPANRWTHLGRFPQVDTPRQLARVLV
ncbi:PHP domain-containing protein [Marinobacterium sp. AK62]|uniref:PHP domain-containing protein n=2 Tax=Marinobacterium alkalitolerans TaxID=1542925 RepID=A0ABS3Z9U5_9GAMM|nr:PHP domain-containing protein [Marinobacterium alkalitolerans]